MMTLEEIRTSEINPLVAREAYDQVSKRLADVLDTKKAYEQKAFTLFNGYVTVSLALFGVGGALIKHNGITPLVLPFLFPGAFFVIGAIFFVMALLDAKYGAIGSSPDMWLNKDVIDGNDATMYLMLAYITFYHHERIEKSTTENNRKALLIIVGIILGCLAPLLMLSLFFVPDAYLKTFLH